MSELDSIFKYKIRDLLMHFTTNPEVEEPQAYMVLERRLQECPGGIQRSYVCRAVQAHANGSVYRNLVEMNEIELVPLPAPEELQQHAQQRRKNSYKCFPWESQAEEKA